jgi:hypothetical protein
MNAAYFHLLINHIPIIGCALTLILLAYALATKKAEVTRASMGLVVLVALGTIPVYVSGDEAMHIMHRMPGIEGRRIHEHKERAEPAAIAVWVTGGLAFLGLVAGRGREVPRWAGVGTLVLLLVANGMLAWAAKAGGEISHPETRPGFVVPAESGGAADH